MDYAEQLAEWKTKHGLDPNTDYGPDELAMIAEDRVSEAQTWCVGCGKQMRVSTMKLISRRIDPYLQMDESADDYIAERKRVRMCCECFAENYGD